MVLGAINQIFKDQLIPLLLKLQNMKTRKNSQVIFLKVNITSTPNLSPSTRKANHKPIPLKNIK